MYSAESKNFWFRVRNYIIGETLLKHVPVNSNIIEVGSGTGFVSKYLKEIGYITNCGELFSEGLKYCQIRNSGYKYWEFNLCEPVFKEEFDAYCAFDVLEHIDDDTTAIQNIYLGLKKKGKVFLTVPACKKLWSDADSGAGHKRRYSADEIREKMEKAGFKIIKISYFMTFLFPIIFASRICMNKNSTHKKAVKENIMELQINPILNWIFYWIFRMEVPLLRYINLPFGSSLLCIAIKEEIS
ncbi:class I SAM-dependent methyltransferase [Methanoplanus limicola]|uniref:Methyltransferase type 11 n=1 Tax=Methanoplanus limicola DSM 2279 TaxID=937775 RepID=H1Z1X7_9EURY|nr:Methyltransferase type 11 [Methanoplanus limicola DSM 2279]